MYLFFDTETNGLPKSWKAKEDDVSNFPRIVQLAYAMYKPNGELVGERVDIIIPEGFTIPKEASDVHGISTERANAEGKPLAEVLTEFQKAVRYSKHLVAHNIKFDFPVVNCEYIRANIGWSGKYLEQICTMLGSMDFCKLPNAYGYSGYKYPNLTELHNILFGEGFDGAHDALVDVQACARCFFELKKREVI